MKWWMVNFFRQIEHSLGEQNQTHGIVTERFPWAILIFFFLSPYLCKKQNWIFTSVARPHDRFVYSFYIACLHYSGTAIVIDLFSHVPLKQTSTRNRSCYSINRCYSVIIVIASGCDLGTISILTRLFSYKLFLLLLLTNPTEWMDEVVRKH